MDMELTEELKRILRCQGADLVGIGDMSKVENCNFKRGVAVAVALPQNVIIDLQDCLLYTSPSPRDLSTSRMPSSA